MTVIRRLTDVALAALVFVALSIWLAAQLAPVADAQVLAIRSGSMTPALGVGSLVLARAVDPAVLAVGDVVTVELANGATVTHRVSRIVEQDDGRLFELKGDRNSNPDPVLVVPAQIVGRIDVALPMLGFVLALLSTAAGVVALASIGAGLLTAAWLLDDLEADRAVEPGARPTAKAYRAWRASAGRGR